MLVYINKIAEFEYAADVQSGVLADIYEKLSRANIQVNESSCIADINVTYGVVLYLSEEDC